MVLNEGRFVGAVSDPAAPTNAFARAVPDSATTTNSFVGAVPDLATHINIFYFIKLLILYFLYHKNAK